MREAKFALPFQVAGVLPEDVIVKIRQRHNGKDVLNETKTYTLDPAKARLELTTTNSDLNTKFRLNRGEYLGVRLADFGKDSGWQTVFGPGGDPVQARLDAMLEAEGVDVALLFAEYSPRTTGIQPIEDLLPLIEYNPGRFRLVANVNPAVHADPAAEAARQLGLGAVAVKLHPVHGAFRPGRQRQGQKGTASHRPPSRRRDRRV